MVINLEMTEHPYNSMGTAYRAKFKANKCQNEKDILITQPTEQGFCRNHIININNCLVKKRRITTAIKVASANTPTTQQSTATTSTTHIHKTTLTDHKHLLCGVVYFDIG